MCDGEPVPVNLEVGGFAVTNVCCVSWGLPLRDAIAWVAGEKRVSTYYAGKRRILKAAATIAH